MEKNKNISVEELLKPIKKRPNLVPRKQFIQSIQKQLQNQPIQKEKQFAFKPIFLSMVAALCFFILVFALDFNKDFNSGETMSFPIFQQEQINQLFTIEYGDASNQIGIKYFDSSREQVTTTAEGFDVQNNEFYIVDNVKKQVYITDKHGKSRIIEIKDALNLIDILVTRDLDIYVLDDDAKVIYRFENNGNLKDTYKTSLQLPTGLAYIPNIGVTVNQAEDFVENIETGEKISAQDLPYKALRVNDLKGNIQLNEDGVVKEVPIPFEHYFGSLSILGLTKDQIVISKYETLNNAPKGEQHVYIMDKKGETLGGARIPLENMIHVNRHFIRADSGQLYFLSAEKEHIAIYEIKLGKTYEKLLSVDDTIVLPDKITLQYSPAEMVTLAQEEPSSEWEKIDEFPIGNLDNSPFILKLYTNKEKSQVNGIVSYKEQRYNLGVLTYGNYDALENLPLNISYEQNQEGNELIGAIGSQEDIGYHYLFYDKKRHSFLRYSNWGVPFIQDINEDGTPEVLMQFEGKGLNFPTVEVLKWNNGIFEVAEVIDSLSSTSSTTQPIQVIYEDKLLKIIIEDDAESTIQYKFVDADELVKFQSTGQ